MVLILGSASIAYFYLSPPKPPPSPVVVNPAPSPPKPLPRPVVVNPPAVIPAGASACEGQTGKVIFEDKFTDDSGGWNFGESFGLTLDAPGAMLKLYSSDESASANLNQTFTATEGDFCTEGPFPADAAKINAGIGVIFWGTDYSNYWMATAYANGKVFLSKLVNNQWWTVFGVATNDVVKTGPTDVNFVRVVVKNGTITIIVNGQTVKSVRAQIPSSDLKFGFGSSYAKASTAPVLFSILSYKVTDSK